MASCELPAHLVDTLKCSLCCEVLSYPPITLYAETGSVCGRCPSLEAERNIEPLRQDSYEKLATLVNFPCRFKAEGCRELLPMDKIPTHEQSCYFKPYFCPVLPLGSCPWQGTTNELHQHFATNHQTMLLENLLFELDVVNDYKEHLLVPCLDELFLLAIEFSNSDETFRYCLHFIGPSNEAVQYKHNIVFKTSDVNVGLVMPEKPVDTEVSLSRKEHASSINLPCLKASLQEPTTITCKLNIVAVEASPQESEASSEDEQECEDEEIKQLIEDTADKMLLDIECPVCQEFMVPPIFQCVTGHSVCGICKPKLKECPTCRGSMGNTRNFTLENITEKIKYSCRNRFEGCNHVSNSSIIRKHEMECKFSPYKCPFKDATNCDWSGLIKNLIPHIRKEHPDNLISPNEAIEVPYDSETNFHEVLKIMEVCREVFRLRFSYNNERKLFYATVKYVGPTMDARKFMHEIQVYDDKKSGLQLMSKKFVGAMNENKNDMAHCTVWCLDMVLPFKASNNVLKFKCKVTKA